MLDLRWLFAGILAVSSWLTPQPQLSSGLLVVYGGQQLVDANAAYHWPGYHLQDVGGCGLSAISPVHLGQLAYMSVDGYNWRGPCRVVDGVAQVDAAGSILGRHEVAEIRRADAHAMGFDHGAQGYLWLGSCPPNYGTPAESYTVPPVYAAYASGGPSIFNGGYPDMLPVQKCGNRR